MVRCFVSHTEATVGDATTVTRKPDPHYTLWPDPVEVSTHWSADTRQSVMVPCSHHTCLGAVPVNCTRDEVMETVATEGHSVISVIVN